MKAKLGSTSMTQKLRANNVTVLVTANLYLVIFLEYCENFKNLNFYDVTCRPSISIEYWISSRVANQITANTLDYE